MKYATTATLFLFLAASQQSAESGLIDGCLSSASQCRQLLLTTALQAPVLHAQNDSRAFLAIAATAAQNAEGKDDQNGDDEEGWISLFNGKDLTGWKISDDGDWEVRDGMIVAQGPRSHLYTEREFKNFDFKAEVMTTPGSNSGIYFHTKYLETGWPMHGHESQVNVTHRDPVKTGSIYNVVRLYETPAKDNEWWTQHIIVEGRRVKVLINDKLVLDYEEPEGVTGTRRISSGCFALQAHDPKSVTYYRNIRVKPLPD